MNRDPKTRLPGSAVLPSYGGRVLPGKSAFALDVNGNYTYTIDNRVQGIYGLSVVGTNFGVELSNVASFAGAKDTLSIVPGSRTFEFNTDAAAKHFVVEIHAKNTDKSVHSAKIDGMANKNAHLSMGFSAAGDTFTYKHQDAAGKVQIKLTHTDHQRKTEVVMAPVDVKPGDELTLRPNWKNLTVAGGGDLVQKDARGATTVRKLKP
jgi:hypothetical protein